MSNGINNENIVSYNDIILRNYQKTYPNLAGFSYDIQNDCLVYEGNYVKLSGYGLSRIDPVFFNMNPEDIFIYFKDGLYQSGDKNAQIEDYFNQLVITEDEEETIKSYVGQYIDKLNIYARNADVFDKYFQNESIRTFMKDLMTTKRIVEEARKQANPNVYNAYQMITNAYNDEMTSMNQNQTQNQSLDKAMTLTRTKPGFSGYTEFDKNLDYLNELNRKDKMGMAGYTSLILIITSAITFGMYLALKLLG